MVKVPEQQFEFARLMSGSGPFRMIPLNFKTREDWFIHAMNMIDGMNLGCVGTSIESDRYKFQFKSQKDMLIFDLATTGDAPYTPEIIVTEDFDDPRFAEIWVSTVKKYFWIKAQMSEYNYIVNSTAHRIKSRHN